MTVVLLYQGAPSERGPAEAKLRRDLRGVDLVSKTGTMLEAPKLSDAQVLQLSRDASWRVVQPSLAEPVPGPAP